MNLRKRTKGICKKCNYCDYYGSKRNNQKQICQNSSMPHGRFPGQLEGCSGFTEITEFNRKRNAKRLGA